LWDKLRGKSNIEEVELEIVEKEDSYSRLNQQIKLNIKARLEKLFSWYGFESVTVNRRGEIIKRTPGRAKYYRENLGKGVYLDMVYVAGGKFMMGSPLSEKDSRDRERPQHEVTVPSYWMGKYAVTQEQWEAVMGDNPSQFKGAKRPVESVSWTKCKEFCKKLSLKIGTTYRLPSEAEWEYGCRAGTTTAFHSGETITTDLANYRGTVIYAEEGMGLYRQETIEVGTFPPNNFGLYEMHGNVWEWCEDEWIERRVLRGGSWINYPYFCRSALRHGSNRADVSNCFGFRLVCLVGRTF
jgi:formylglycine-generating enzyme required for sulfatase activity